MFEGFDEKSRSKDRRRFGLSLAVSSAVYLSVFGTVVAASAAVRRAVQEEKLVQVELKAPPPEPPPPPPPEAPKPEPVRSTAPARAKAVRPELTPPDEVPDEKPAESDEALAEAPPADQGQTGFLTGVVGGTGTAEHAPPPPPPPPPPKKVIAKPSAPIRDGSTRYPEYPRSARRAGVVGTVVARIYVGASGAVTKVEILEGPEIFHEAVREALLTWRYTPARMPDGTAVPDTHIVRIPFQLN